MAGFSLWVRVLDATHDGLPLPAATVTATLQAGSDEAGDAKTDVVWITVEHDGYTPYLDQPYTAPSMDAPIVIGLAVAPPPPEPIPPEPPPGVDLPELEIRGHCFQQASVPGHGPIPWTAIQCSDFNLLNRFQHGEDITPVLTQRRDCGFTLLRVWTAYDIDKIGTYLDIDYSVVPAFVDACESYGLYVEFCAYTGINDPAHWGRLCDAARACRPRPLLELVNELSENTDEPDPHGRVFNLHDYSRPTDLIVSRGSNGSEKPPVGSDWDFGQDQWAHFGMTEPLPAYWSYTTMHFNDAHEWQRKVGHNAMEIWGGPTLSNENTRYCDKAQNEAWAHDAAAGAALLCAGSCYHSVAGKTSAVWPGDEEDAARAWAKGARSVNLQYQDGAYTHDSTCIAIEEANGYLRVYRRTFGAEYEQVEIRK